MSLNQYLKTDQYFSDTWDNTGEQATNIIKNCNIPLDLLSRVNASVEITLVEWCNNHWLHEFLLDVAHGTDDLGYVLIDHDVLKKFVELADKVIEDPSLMEETFPYPSWWQDVKGEYPTYSDYDYDVLIGTTHKFKRILSELPNVDLVYKFSV